MKLMNDEETIWDLEFAKKRLDICKENFAAESIVMTSTLPSFIAGLKERSTKTLNQFNGMSNLFNNLLNGFSRNIKEKDLENLNFVAFSTVLITVPEGFNGNLAMYSKVCAEVYERVVPASFKYLNELNRSLGVIITNREEKTSVKSYHDLFTSYKKLREDCEKITSSFFEKSTQSKRTVGDVLSSKKEVIELLENIKSLETQVKSTNINSIVHSVYETNDYLNELNKQIKNNPEIKMSSQVIELVSEGTYECAMYFEYLGTLFYDVDVLINITKELMEKIKKGM